MFEHVPEDVKLKQIQIDDEYEYGEMTFSEVFKSILKENVKQLPTMSEDDPRRDKVTQIVQYVDEYLPSLGWKLFEVVHKIDENGKMDINEVRRFRRPAVKVLSINEDWDKKL